MTIETILKRIQKLVKLAESESGKPEGDLAASLARKLMLQHAISEAQIQTEVSKAERIEGVRYDLTAKQNWRRRLLQLCAEHCECTTAFFPATTFVTIYGYTSDVEIATYLYDSLVNQLLIECNLYMRFRPATTKRTRNSFFHSAVDAVGTRLRAMREHEAANEPTGQALVLRRGAAVKTWIEDNVRLKKGAPVKRGFSAEGYEAGNRVSLGAGIAGETIKKLE
jgi:hypothetical protein